MKIKEIALLWDISERTVRNYCSDGKIEGAVIIGKTWHIPENATNPNPKKIIYPIFLKQNLEQK